MTGKISKIFIFSLMILQLTMIKAQHDCSGKDFLCATENTYLICLYDETLDTTVTAPGRSELCPTGTFCDSSKDSACNPIDCAGKSFFCPNDNSYIRCGVQSDGTSITISNELIPCADGTYCDNYFGQNECDSLLIPSPTTDFSSTTSDEPVTDASTNTDETTILTTEDTTTTLATEVSITTTQATTAAPSLDDLSGYTCAGRGLFPHPTNCRRYIYCDISGSTYTIRQLQCSNDLVYHSELQGCTTDTTPCDNLDFKCVATGRFADPLNPNKYFWCLKVNGNYLKLKYSCPVGKLYDGINACIEPIITNAIETFALFEEDPLNLYSTSRRSLSIQDNDEADEERYVESDEMVADRINLNSNEDASVYNHRTGEANYRL